MAAAALILLALVSSALSQKVVPIGTHYTTVDVQRFDPKAQHVFVASTCGNFDGFDVNVGILLFHNPDWYISRGVVRFYVTDVEPVVGGVPNGDGILCTNEISAGAQPTPNCTVSKWDGSKKRLYVVTTNGNVGGIDFSVTVEFTEPNLSNVHVPRPRLYSFLDNDLESLYPNGATTYLTQTVKMDSEVSLLYHENVLLEFAFCPDEGTTKHYEILSTVFGTEIHSAFNQYLCTALPCNPDSPHVVNSNPNEVALNTAMILTSIGDISKVYVSIYCWGGEYDKQAGSYRGHFQYGASLNKL